MRLLPALLAVLVAGPASAQVTVDLRALDAPGSSQAQSKRPARSSDRPRHSTKTAKKPATPPAVVAQPVAPAAPKNSPATPPAPQPPVATLPVAPPPVVSLSPGAPAVPAPPVPAPAPPVAVAPDAGGTATAVTGGLVVSFAAGRGDISPATELALKDLVESYGRTPGATYNVLGYAAAKPDDPSTPRRESLSRALTVRGALIADGVQSARIYTRAMGAPPSGSDASPDRVEITVSGANAPPPPPSPAPSAPPPPTANAAPPPPPVIAAPVVAPPPKAPVVSAPVVVAPPSPPPRVDLSDPPLTPSRPIMPR